MYYDMFINIESTSVKLKAYRTVNKLLFELNTTQSTGTYTCIQHWAAYFNAKLKRQ